MTTVRTIISSELDEYGRWLVYYTLTDGTKHLCAFPHSQLTYRVAEYGLDPKDFDKLISFVLSELVDSARMSVSDTHQHFLYNTSEQTARQTALLRLSAIEADTTYQDPDGHLGKLKDAYLKGWDQTFHDNHKRLVASLRYYRMKQLGLPLSSIPSPDLPSRDIMTQLRLGKRSSG